MVPALARSRSLPRLMRSCRIYSLGYGCFQPETTETTYTIAAADADRFKTEGMRIKGTGLDVSKVEIGKLGLSAIDAVEAAAAAPVEYYNLNGVKVSVPSAGVYIRKQGNVVEKVVIM